MDNWGLLREPGSAQPPSIPMGPSDPYDHLPPYARVLLMIDDLYLHLRRVESEVAAYINKSGVPWDQIAELFASRTKDGPMTNEGARKHYAKPPDDGPHLPPRFAHQPRGRPRRHPRKKQ